ncbi:retrovirus-related pol polyprotein from transposon TNT 1-94 [Tanacetum coccineum]
MGLFEFCGVKGVSRGKRAMPRTHITNGVAERKNKTLIEAARTMLADSFLPNTFWAEAVSTACYILNRVLVTKPHNKTPYELLTGKTPIISYKTFLGAMDHLELHRPLAQENQLTYCRDNKNLTKYEVLPQTIFFKSDKKEGKGKSREEEQNLSGWILQRLLRQEKRS